MAADLDKVTARAIKLVRSGQYTRSLELAKRHMDSATGQFLRCLVAISLRQLGSLESSKEISNSLLGDSLASSLDKLRACHNLALIARQHGSYHEALEYLDSMLRFDDGRYEATYFYECGGIYMLQGRFGEARQALRTAIRLNSVPDDRRAARAQRKNRCALAMALGYQGDPKRGLRLINEIEFPPTDRFSAAVKEMYSGSLLILADDSEVALAHLEEAIQIMNGLHVLGAGAAAYNLLSDAKLRCGDFSEAHRCAQLGYRAALKTSDVFEIARSKLMFSSLCDEWNDSGRADAYRKEAALTLHRIGSEWVFDRHIALMSSKEKTSR